MYVGNLSNFFYKDKNWLFKQPKFSIQDNPIHNIIKIGKNYYTSDNLSGKLELIKSNTISQIINEQNNEKENNDFFPKILGNIKKNNSYNTNSETNYEKNSSNNQILSICSNIKEERSQSKDINVTKIENKLLNNSSANVDDNIIVDVKEKKPHDRKNNDRIIFKKKFKKNNTTPKDNKSIKRKIRKISDKRKKYIEDLKSTMTINDNSNNNTLIIMSKSIDNRNNKYKISVKDMKQVDLSKVFFPNDKSLKIKNGDSWYLKTLKNQVYKDRVFNDLKKKYQFYEDSFNKREDLEIPKLNFKKEMLLNKNIIFPTKETIYHKIFFNYIKKEKKDDKDNDKYPLIYNKKYY